MHAHAHDFRSEIAKTEAAKADHVLRNWRTAPLSARERAICDYAAKLCGKPGSVVPDDLAPLRAAGLDDATITDVVQVVAYFCYINRIAEGLGVDPEPFMPVRHARGGPGDHSGA